jgi:hypothetical protein
VHGTSSSTTWPTGAGAAPLHATPRNPDRPNDGAAIAAVARSLGKQLLPWQQYVADVATERRADGSYEYQVVIVTVPRQCGKTTLIHAMGVHRAGLLGKSVHYTAQTGQDARKRWGELAQAVRDSPVWEERATPSQPMRPGMFDVTLRGGSECVNFFTGAGVHCFAPVAKKAMHGSTPHVVVLDEAYAHDEATGAQLMGAIKPAQQTILARQLWIVSTMGTAESVFLHDWIDTALEQPPRVALFYWGAPDDDAPFTLDGIAGYHPGVGHHLNEKTLTADDVLAEAGGMPRAEYVRAFGNRRTRTSANIIPVDIWRTLGTDHLPPPTDTRTITLAYGVALDGLSSSIVATWPLDYGRAAAKVVQAGPGSSWLPTALDQLVRSWRPAALTTFGHTSLEVTAQLADLGHDPTVLDTTSYAGATALTLDRIRERRLVHDRGDTLEVSVTGLTTRPSAHGGQVFDLRTSVGDSSAGIALAAALWLTEHNTDTGQPLIHFAS